MPRGGNNKLPPMVHLLRGTFQPCRHGDRREARETLERSMLGATVEPLPGPPRWLPASARAEWRRVARLVGAGLDARDVGVLIAHCSALARLREAEDLLAREGLVIVTERGTSKHPAVGVQVAAWSALRQVALLLGLAPTARPKVVPQPEPDKTDSDFS